MESRIRCRREIATADTHLLFMMIASQSSVLVLLTSVAVGTGITTGINWGTAGCTSYWPCNVGVADCDSDSECKEGLFCFQRSKNETWPGYDLSAVPDDYDVCVQDPAKDIVGINYGVAGCTSYWPCNDGVADCDSDSECKEGLFCFQRSNGETWPGYDLSAVPDNYDVCVSASSSNSSSNSSSSSLGYEASAVSKSTNSKHASFLSLHAAAVAFGCVALVASVAVAAVVVRRSQRTTGVAPPQLV